MVDSKRFLDWIKKSAADIKAAGILKKYEAGNDYVAFHSQQAIEKALKGYLLYHTGELEEGHSLIFLCKKAIAFEPYFKEFLKDCAYVNQYYIETRYPADFPLEVSDEEAEECIKLAERIYQYISVKISK